MDNKPLPVSDFLSGSTIITPPPQVSPKHVTPEAFDLYGDELDKVNRVFTKIKGMFEYTPMNDDAGREHFEEVAKNEFGEVGFLVEVDWYLVRVPGDEPGTFVDVAYQGRPLFSPKIVFMGRVDPETEIDHDRIRHGVVTGKYDGVKGYIRPGQDGLHEDPIRKIIT